MESTKTEETPQLRPAPLHEGSPKSILTIPSLRVSHPGKLTQAELNRRLETVPLRYRAAQIKAMQKRLSPRQAIAQTCRECVGFEETRERIKNCTSFMCPINAYRPYQADEIDVCYDD